MQHFPSGNVFVCVKSEVLKNFHWIDLFCAFLVTCRIRAKWSKKHISPSAVTTPKRNSVMQGAADKLRGKKKACQCDGGKGGKKTPGCVSQESIRLFSLFDLNWQPKLPLHKWLQAAGGGTLSFTPTSTNLAWKDPRLNNLMCSWRLCNAKCYCYLSTSYSMN